MIKTKNKTLFILLIIIGFIFFTYLFTKIQSKNSNLISANQIKIFISKVTDHPAIDATILGIIDKLKENGYINGRNIDIRIESAQSSPTLAAQIATNFASKNPNIVIGVGTISAQSLLKNAIAKKYCLIFSSVTDPLGAKLINSIDNSGNNTSGVSNFVPLEPQLNLFKEIQPNLKNLGILYNPGEINSISIIEKLEKLCIKYNINLIKQTVTKTSEITQSTASLIKKVDAIFISNDNTVLSALSNVIKIANQFKIPVYVSDSDAVKLGAIAALGPNQYEIGKQTGLIVIRVLHGEDINSISTEFGSKTELYINLSAAKTIGLQIPDKILKSAIKIIE